MNAAVMDQIAIAGLKIVFSLKDTYYNGSACWPPNITSRAAEEQFIRAQIRQFREKRALLGWCDLRHRDTYQLIWRRCPCNILK